MMERAAVRVGSESGETVTAVRAALKDADAVWTRGPGQAPAIAKVRQHKLKGAHGRVAIVAGCRTPFVKAGTDFAAMDVVDLASVPVAALIHRTALDPREIELSIFGVVVPALYAPNLGREVILRTGLPKTIPGITVNLACASANRAITQGAEAILTGQADVVLVGGAESLSSVPIVYSRRASQRFIEMSRARSVTQKIGILSRLRPRDLKPVPPAIAEYTTGLSMGQSCEKMAKENAISRQAQDEIALLSHQRAAGAFALGHFAEQIVPTFPEPGYDRVINHDTGVRGDTSLAALGQLKPVFDRAYGTLTAGNSSPLTDGAAALLLMSEEKAKALGYRPLGFLRSYAYAALDPGTQLLQGPAYAAPLALERAGLKLKEIALVEMHEAFAAQVLSNMKALASRRFAQDELGRSEAVGEIDLDRCNVSGGSIAIGHPFGATGGRVTIQMLAELQRRDLEFGLITVCAQGGNGCAMVVER